MPEKWLLDSEIIKLTQILHELAVFVCKGFGLEAGSELKLHVTSKF